jgi:hypothetical protein
MDIKADINGSSKKKLKNDIHESAHQLGSFEESQNSINCNRMQCIYSRQAAAQRTTSNHRMSQITNCYKLMNRFGSEKIRRIRCIAFPDSQNRRDSPSTSRKIVISQTIIIKLITCSFKESSRESRKPTWFHGQNFRQLKVSEVAKHT